MNPELQNQVAHRMARELVEVIVNCLRPEERRDAFEEFYRVCKSGIEGYEAQRTRESKQRTRNEN